MRTYLDFIPGYTWSYDGSLASGTLDIGYAATAVFTVTSSNHGDFVSQSTDKAAAARS